VKPLKKLFEYKNKVEITPENFIEFFDIFLKKIKKHTPFIIRVVLKLINEYVKSNFKIEPENISPLYTSYIFNFIMSPRIMDYYDISPSKFSTIRLINRIIRVRSEKIYNQMFKFI
jgi:hypothetical protein